MKKFITLLLVILPLCGCASFKESVGEYVTEAVTKKVISDVDSLLDKRGLSRSEIKNVLDENNDGTVDRSEILEATKSATRDAVLLEAKNAIDERIASYQANLVHNGSLESHMSKIWIYLLTIISGYLGKQVYSAKQDSKRDQRLALLEKILQRDIDGDGNIGLPPTEKAEDSEPGLI